MPPAEDCLGEELEKPCVMVPPVRTSPGLCPQSLLRRDSEVNTSTRGPGESSLGEAQGSLMTWWL